jgi:hypothetical protein
MPRLTDRIAKAETVHPLIVRLLADEGPSAVTYRRVAAEAGLTLAEVRSVWTTQGALLQRGAATALATCASPRFLPARDADPAEVLREGIRRLLPRTDEQRQAFRALESLRWTSAATAARAALDAHDRSRMLRVLELIDEVRTLRLPQARRPRSWTADGIRERQQRSLEGPEVLVLATVHGLSGLTARVSGALSAAHVEACLGLLDLRLLD